MTIKKQTGAEPTADLNNSCRPLSRVQLKVAADGEIRLYRRRLLSGNSNGGQVKRRAAADAKCASGALSSIATKAKIFSAETVTAASNPPVMRNVTTFTRLARATVREAAAAIDRHVGRRALFLTGTLPGSTPLAIVSMAKHAGTIIARVTQWLRDAAPMGLLVWVWEVQKRGALHLHVCIGTRDRLEQRRIKRGWHKYWCRMLSNLSEDIGVDLFAREDGKTWRNNWRAVRADAQFVRKSVGRYLSKYLSKTASKATGADTCPPRWWSCNRRVRSAFKAMRQWCVLAPIHGYYASQLFSRLAGEAMALAAAAYPYRSPCDESFSALVVYPPDNDGGQLFALLQRLLDSECQAMGIKICWNTTRNI